MRSAHIKIFIILIFLLTLTWLSSPIYIDYYFSKQPVLTIEKSIPSHGTNTLLGRVVVLEGTISRSFLEDVNNNIIAIRYTDKLNCIPEQGQNIKIAGSYNPGKNFTSHNMDVVFYAVWVVGGCDDV